MLHSGLHPGLSRVHGTGIIALRDIPMGTAVWWPCPKCSVLTSNQQATAPPEVLAWLFEYGYRRADDGLILPCRGAHLFNHSCEASVLDYGLSVGITVVAVSRGDELTCDYRTFRFDDPWSFRCDCGTAVCTGSVTSSRGKVPPDLTREWRRRMAAALDAAGQVPQETTVTSGDINGYRHADA